MYSNFFKNGLIATLLFILTQTVFGSEIKLLDISNDEDSNISVIGIVIDDAIGEATRIYKRDVTKKKKVLRYKEYNLKDMESGIVLVESKDRKIVVLKSMNFHPADGADLELDYLYSGVTGARKQEDLAVEKVGKEWITRMDGNKVKKLHFVSNKSWVLGTIGIKKIEKMSAEEKLLAQINQIDNNVSE